ncbi:MAG TPA: alpha/beta hydrolase [Firmicutes bacterium]|nr:alpha/beta hydrolase [Bacillota bacterium]
MTFFTTEHKKVDVFPSTDPDKPVIYLNTFGQEGKQVFQQLQAAGCPDFTLVAVSDLEWEHDMSPWDIPPISEKGTPCTGGANDYLTLLLGKIMPEAEKAVKGEPAWRGVAGYSLAGLFAVYAVYQTDAFSRVASISGSLWFPGIQEYIFSHETKGKPDYMYFSLGDRESHTRNRFLKCVRQNTENIKAFYQSHGIHTVFQLNPGSHYESAAERTAAGIAWILNR